MIQEMHAIVKGRVQGVCFRATTARIAYALKVVGTVQNLADGTVEIYALGTQDQLDQLINQLYEEFGEEHIHGIEKEYSQIKGSFQSFRII